VVPEPVIKVVGAAIISGGNLLCAQRNKPAELQGKWEFPGGKIEELETPEQALAREITEELGCHIRVGDLLAKSQYNYESQQVELAVYICELVEGEPQPTEHKELRWQPISALKALDWAPADREAVNILIAGFYPQYQSDQEQEDAKSLV